MPDPVSHEEKTQWFAELLKVQEEVAAQRSAAMVGQTYRVLVEERNRKVRPAFGPHGLQRGHRLPRRGELVGQYAQVKVTAARSWMLSGELAE